MHKIKNSSTYSSNQNKPYAFSFFHSFEHNFTTQISNLFDLTKLSLGSSIAAQYVLAVLRLLVPDLFLAKACKVNGAYGFGARYSSNQSLFFLKSKNKRAKIKFFNISTGSKNTFLDEEIT